MEVHLEQVRIRLTWLLRPLDAAVRNRMRRTSRTKVSALFQVFSAIVVYFYKTTHVKGEAISVNVRPVCLPTSVSLSESVGGAQDRLPRGEQTGPARTCSGFCA